VSAWFQKWAPAGIDGIHAVAQFTAELHLPRIGDFKFRQLSRKRCDSRVASGFCQLIQDRLCAACGELGLVHGCVLNPQAGPMRSCRLCVTAGLTEAPALPARSLFPSRVRERHVFAACGDGPSRQRPDHARLDPQSPASPPNPRSANCLPPINFDSNDWCAVDRRLRLQSGAKKRGSCRRRSSPAGLPPLRPVLLVRSERPRQAR
jgi:hypothetical protein